MQLPVYGGGSKVFTVQEEKETLEQIGATISRVQESGSSCTSSKTLTRSLSCEARYE